MEELIREEFILKLQRSMLATSLTLVEPLFQKPALCSSHGRKIPTLISLLIGFALFPSQVLCNQGRDGQPLARSSIRPRTSQLPPTRRLLARNPTLSRQVAGPKVAMTFPNHPVRLSSVGMTMPHNNFPGSRSGTSLGHLRTPGGALRAASDAAPQQSQFKALAYKVLDKLNHLAETQASIILLAATALSILLANLPATTNAWMSLWNTHVGPPIGQHQLTVKGWVNEGLMTLFFFVVGLELKKDLLVGSLASVRKALLPCIAALGGMVVPMLVYTVINIVKGGTLTGVTVPMATDIAFACGIFGFFRSRMAKSMFPFLLTLATVDDLGAMIVIATCFASGLNVMYLTAAVAITGMMTLMARFNVKRMSWFVPTGASLWYCFMRGGINSDIAGAVTAMFIPCPNKDCSQLDRLARRWVPMSSLLIMPLFALANMAVPLFGVAPASASSSAMAAQTWGPVGIGAGLLLGKPLGIVSFSLLAIWLKICKLPSDMRVMDLGIIGLLGGIGFTMSLFLVECSLSQSLQIPAKLAVLFGSVASALVASFAMATYKVQPVAAIDDGFHNAESLDANSTLLKPLAMEGSVEVNDPKKD